MSVMEGLLDHSLPTVRRKRTGAISRILPMQSILFVGALVAFIGTYSPALTLIHSKTITAPKR